MRTLFILILTALCCFGDLRFKVKYSVPIPTTNTVDFWNGFEVTTAGNGGLYTSNDVVSSTVASSGSYVTIRSNPPTASYSITNTFGMSVFKVLSIGTTNVMATNNAWVQAARIEEPVDFVYQLTNYVTNASCGFWFRTTGTGAAYAYNDVFSFGSVTNSGALVIQFHDSSPIGIDAESSTPPTTVSDKVSISTASNYWITAKYTCNPSVTNIIISVYDNSLQLVGSTTNSASDLAQINRFRFPAYSPYYTAGKTNYFDSLMIDWGNYGTRSVTFPLLPR